MRKEYAPHSDRSTDQTRRFYCRTADGRMPRETIIELGGTGEEFFIQRDRHHRRHRHDHGGWFNDGPTWKEYYRLKDARDTLARERDCLKVELKKARADLSHRDEEICHLKAELKKARSDLSHRDSEVCRLKEEKNILCREIEELKKHHGGWDDRCREWRNKWTREKNENETLREKLRIRDEQLSKLEASVACLKGDSEHWKRYALRVEDENKHLRWKIRYYETAPIRRHRFF
ncbi:hypothetical protein PpBr36_04382 [Pyricularia pennisetigena]|uniref:hypothetical protein n=1 Tax=Pyricularia pennisetigena TaxID=1578925 RepID=UPI00114DFD2B|nr:hypothetical protein PpBr36_04382 [Pyricularia pennisetigena]TLS27115.1 hypothetical protein PpBr36_04382 [Pyricularia pennisetigena]